MEDFLFFLLIQQRFCILSTFFICFFPIYAHSNYCSEDFQVFTFNNSSRDHDHKIIDNYFQATSYQIKNIAYDADVYIDQNEFSYLTDIYPGKIVRAETIKQAIFYLFQKNKFEQITLECSRVDNMLDLKFVMKGFWTFSKLKIYGIWFGSHAYSRYYVMHAGDRFEEEKHSYSIQKIKDALHKEGFMQAQISSDFIHNEHTKEITAYVTINRGPRSIIQKVYITTQTDDKILEQELPILEEQLKKRFSARLMKRYYAYADLVEQAQTIKKYLAQKGYLSVSINLEESRAQNGNIMLNWCVTIHQKKLFVFFGNHFFSHRQLFDLVMQFGRSVWILPPAILAQEIVRFYKEKGFFNIVVEAKEEQNRYLFIIREGRRASLNAIVMKGTHYFSPVFLKKHCFATLSKGAYIDQGLIKTGIDFLQKIYHERGFFEMQVLGYDLVSRETDQLYDLMIVIKEGQRAFIKKISIPNYDHLIKQEPFVRYTLANEAIPCDASTIQQQRQWLTNHFHAMGYINVELQSEFIRCINNDYELVWHIKPGLHVRCGKTVLLGSHTLPFNTIFREIGDQQGCVWNQDLLKQTFMRLKSYELFDELQIMGGQECDEHYGKPILIKMYQDDPYECRLRGGIELEHVKQYRSLMGLSYRGGGTFFIKNPFEAFDLIRFDANIASLHREITVRYERPWLASLPVKILGECYSINYDQPGFINTNKNIYSIGQNGFLIGFAHKDQAFDGEITFGVEWMKTKPLDEVPTKRLIAQIANAIDFEVNFFNVWVPYVFTEQTIVFDYLDDKLNPHKGLFSLISLKGMFPLNMDQRKGLFLRLQVEQSLFLPIGSSVAAMRIRLGHIFYQQFKAIMPSERFYLGGSHSLRSYDTDLVPPLGVFIDDQGHEQVVPRGGKSMFNMMLELRFLLPKLPTIGAVIFHDCGVLSGQTVLDCLQSSWHMGTGFGIRYFTPIGPLRLDIGFKWSSHGLQERAYAWFLTFGQAF